jgi:carbamoyl-phosphate synthase large subunit
LPKRTDIQSILLIGAGPIVIGQACEFDYSGTQACRALKAEGYRVILVNSNPATIMTDPGFADATYIEPVTAEVVAKVIEKERPDALLPTMGGQTALNVAMQLADSGILEKFGVQMIGANRDAIRKAEDRDLFRKAMDRIGLESPKSFAVHSLQEARLALQTIGLPAIIRASFTLGGTGSGIARDAQSFDEIVNAGLEASMIHEVLIEESVLGWKEFEMEVVRDGRDNCIIVCSIENVDPMGVHTGDSITVAPALTLTDKELQIMRDASIAVLREIGVETGGSNVQFAIDPKSGRMVVIEMNPRVSRSSALASKATGFPIAKVAARLAIGYTLDELMNDITGVTPAAFEPTIDYVVTKIPRFTFEKFPGTPNELNTSMKSVGEAMAIGRNFPESLQKALRSMEIGLTGLSELDDDGPARSREELLAACAKATPERPLHIAAALRAGLTVEAIHDASKIDPWFLRHFRDIVAAESGVRSRGLPPTAAGMRALKQAGFSDARLAELANTTAETVLKHRRRLGVVPVFKRVDTCAAEFDSRTPYMYSTYESDGWDGSAKGPNAIAADEAQPSDKRKVIVLGGGPNRIGQGIEFDYCCVHAAFALRAAGIEAIMINCNPETVSTDYDTSDRLYFEPLTIEDVLEIVRIEQVKGTVLGLIVQFGGQTPLKLANGLEQAGVPILGTSPDAIDLAEDRKRFQGLLERLSLLQPKNATATSVTEAVRVAKDIGYPVVIRPSYVLGGRAMEIVHDEANLLRYMKTAVRVSGASPVLIDSYLSNAAEIDVDSLADGDDVFVAGIMEHIEEAGIHSGDSACSLPPYSLKPAIVSEIERQTEAMAKALKVIGLMNVQFAVKDERVYVLEVNPRASRTVPFVAKATGRPVAKIAARLMAGEKLKAFSLPTRDRQFSAAKPKHVSVKEAVFPFDRFPGVDVLLGPEMKSTGEVMGIDRDFNRAFAKSQLASGVKLPNEGTVFVSVRDADKRTIVTIARDLQGLGFKVIATRGTAKVLNEQGVTAVTINKVVEGSPHVVDLMKNGGVQLVINTVGIGPSIADSFDIRRTALIQKIPHYTTTAGARAMVLAIASLRAGALEVAPLQSYSTSTF